MPDPYRAWLEGAGEVGAAQNPFLRAAEAAQQKAFAASNKASDSGAVAFQTHTSYSQAIRDNHAAAKAWERARVAAAAVSAVQPSVRVWEFAQLAEAKHTAAGWEEDAVARVGELHVAYVALMQDLAAHMRIVVTSKPSMSRGAKVGLFAAAVAGISKALGWW